MIANNKIKVLIIGILILTSAEAYASLSAHPAQLTETIAPGENKTLVLHIINLGPSGSLGFTISSSQGWASVDPAAGNLNVNDTAGIRIAIDASYLKPGSNKAEITLGDLHHGSIAIPIEINVTTISDVEEKWDGKSMFLKASPNPVNFQTEISYYLPSQQNVTLDLYDMNGKLIKTMVNEIQSAGFHKMLHHVSEFPAGYFYMALRVPFNTVVSPLIINK